MSWFVWEDSPSCILVPVTFSISWASQPQTSFVLEKIKWLLWALWHWARSHCLIGWCWPSGTCPSGTQPQAYDPWGSYAACDKHFSGGPDGHPLCSFLGGFGTKFERAVSSFQPRKKKKKRIKRWHKDIF